VLLVPLHEALVTAKSLRPVDNHRSGSSEENFVFSVLCCFIFQSNFKSAAFGHISPKDPRAIDLVGQPEHEIS
jgi:hypothetical protein